MVYKSITIVILVVLNTTIGVPVRNKRNVRDIPWSHPCFPHGDTSGQTLPPGMAPPPTQTPPSAKDLIESFRYRIADTATKSENLRQAMFTDRLESSLILASAYDKMHVEGMPLLSDIENWKNSNDTANVTKADYKSLSKIQVFLEQVRLDEIEHHNSTMKKFIDDTIDYIYDSLCTLDDLLSCLNGKIESHVSRDVMPQSQREITVIALRNQRDYVIAKDSMHFLFALKNSYIDILSQI